MGNGGVLMPPTPPPNPEGQKQVPSPEAEKWAPITKKILIHSTLYPLFWTIFTVHVSSSNQIENLLHEANDLKIIFI